MDKEFNITGTCIPEKHYMVNTKDKLLELKIWRGEEYHKHGILQLANYLNQYELDEGYLLIFDLRKQKFNWLQ